MAGHIKSARLIAAFLIIFLPYPTLAEDVDFSVIPAEIHIDNLPPGEAAEFELTIHNRDDLAHNFSVATCPPPEEEIREGRTEFPDGSWIGFSSPKVEIGPDSRANVMVTVTIPQEQKWASEDWETWLGVTAVSGDVLGARLYVRLLVSTSGIRFNGRLFIGIAVAIVLLGYGGYRYFRHRTNPINR
jgi:hypothetical protein